MVSLETEAGGLLVLRFVPPYEPGDEAAYLAALEAIGEMPRDYLLLALFGGGPGLSQQGERAQALWFKRTRALVEARCRAMALARPGATPRMAEIFGKLWRLPLTATESEGEARAFLARFMPLS